MDNDRFRFVDMDEDDVLDQMGEMETAEVEDGAYYPALFVGRINLANESGRELYGRVWGEYLALTETRDRLFAQQNPNGRSIVGIIRSMNELREVMRELALSGQDLTYILADLRNKAEGN